MAEFIITYLVYILAIVAVVFIFEFFHLKLEILRTKKKLISELMEAKIELPTETISNFLNSK